MIFVHCQVNLKDKRGKTKQPGADRIMFGFRKAPIWKTEKSHQPSSKKLHFQPFKIL